MKKEARVLPLVAPRLKDLTAPFAESDIEWRVQRSGMSNGRPWALVLAYVDARAVQNRLDEVVGPENWTVAYQHIPGGVMCSLSIKCNGEWVTKSDGSPETSIEAFKGGISKALVRAASVWGIGRYLYRLPEGFARFVDKRSEGAREVKVEGQSFYWLPPALPAWALPEGNAAHPASFGAGGALGRQVAEGEKDGATIEEQVPLAVVSQYFKPEDDDYLGAYVVNFGRKHFGKHLAEMEVSEIEGYRDWLLEDSRKSGKPVSGKAADFLQAAEAFLNNFRSEQKAQVAEDVSGAEKEDVIPF